MKLQDNIHYYIGCEVIVDGKERARLIGGSFVPNSCNQIYYDLQTEEMKAEDIDFAMPYNDDADDPEPRIKPILRKLTDITEEESNEYRKFLYGRTDGAHSVIMLVETPRSFDYLIKKHFDVFGLINKGLAIDSKTLK